MAPSPHPRHLLRLAPVVALLFSLIVAVGPVAAAAPTVAANPALVPFDTTPGKLGTTTLTFTANGTAGLTACGQDNAQTPFALGPVAANTPLVINFPFIQAGKYTFWVGTDPSCAGTKLATATATRVGPFGKAGADDIQFRQTGQPNIVNTDGTADLDLLILGQSVPPPATTVQQKFPIPGVQVCIMSGDGAQVNIDVKIGQDSRDKGLGTAAVTTTVRPFAGQNGCFDVPWLVNGGYTAMIARSSTAATFGYCTANSKNAPNGATTATIGKCAQVAFNPPEGSTLIGVQINGSIVTGADNHAVQVCVSSFTPNPIGVPDVALKNTVNAYNQSGAVNLTPLTLTGFTAGSAARVTTYDITGPGPGGQGGAQFVCPTTTATQAGPAGQITAITTPAVPGATAIDSKVYTSLG